MSHGRHPATLLSQGAVSVGAVALIVATVVMGVRVSALGAQSAGAQTPAASAVAFDVASVKPAQQQQAGMMRVGVVPQPGGRFVATNVNLAILIQAAFLLKGPKQVAGSPGWGDSDRFDIEGKASGVTGTLSTDQLAPYLQALLESRFKLATHRETRQLPVYALVLAKPGKLGPQLKPHTDDSGCVDPTGSRAAPLPPGPGGVPAMPAFCGGLGAMMSPDGMRVAGNRVTMEMLASQLSAGPFLNSLDRIVVDRTGLTGTYDLNLNFMPAGLPPVPAGLGVGGPPPGANAGPDAVASDADSSTSLPAALQEQLGLKLEPQTGPVAVLVIDHVERPTQN